jgi:hypothetical protein
MRRQPLLMLAVGNAVFDGELDRALRIRRFRGRSLDARDTPALEL